MQQDPSQADDFGDMGMPQMTLADFVMQLSTHAALSFGRRAMWAPVGRVAILMTVQGELVRDQRLSAAGFSGTLGCIKFIYMREGPTAFFRGLWTEAVLSVPSTIVEEVASSVASNLLQQSLGDAAVDMPQIAILGVSLLASAVVAQITAVVNDPIQTLLTCYTADVAVSKNEASATHKFSGPWAAARDIYGRSGTRGFFRGVSLTMVASVAYRGSYYMLLHLVLSGMGPQSQEAYGLWAARVLALVAGIIAQPVEVVRRRMMLTASADRPGYKGVCDCVRTIAKEEGPLALWSGLKVRIFMSAAGFGVTMLQGFVGNLLAAAPAAPSQPPQ